MEQANIHEHEERNHVYEDELRQRLHEITLQNQLTELVAAKRYPKLSFPHQTTLAVMPFWTVIDHYPVLVTRSELGG